MYGENYGEHVWYYYVKPTLREAALKTGDSQKEMLN